MKVEELRIGNYVENEQTYFALTKSQLIGALQNEKNFLDWVHPIPLTEEWLVKLGFEKGNNLFLSPNENSVEGFVDILCYNLQTFEFIVDASEYSGWVVKCEYVHQLQNLYFALINEELTI